MQFTIIFFSQKRYDYSVCYCNVPFSFCNESSFSLKFYIYFPIFCLFISYLHPFYFPFSQIFSFLDFIWSYSSIFLSLGLFHILLAVYLYLCIFLPSSFFFLSLINFYLFNFYFVFVFFSLSFSLFVSFSLCLFLIFVTFSL